MKVFLNGKFVDAKNAKISVFDNGFLYGDGVYETLRTYNGKIWRINEHVKRLRNSAKLISIKIPWSSAEIKKWMEELVRKNGFKESRIRLTVTRGENGFDFKSCPNPSILIVAEKLKDQPKRIYEKGVEAITINMKRVLPEAKSISLLPLVIARAGMKPHVYEVIFTGEENLVTEGTVTNVFIVKKGAIFTPKDNVLKGTTRGFILKMAREIGQDVNVKNFTMEEMLGADEIFITNAPRGIVPVCRVNGRKIGTGKPGKITTLFMKTFMDKIKKYG